MTNAPRRSGVYIYIFEIAEGGPVKVGALGWVDVEPGLHAYVGSAKHALDKRLKRHRRKRKPKRWHIDYLARLARPIGAVTWSWRPGRECRLAECVAGLGLGELAVLRFGASDCSCRGHLFRLGAATIDELARRISGEIGQVGTFESYLETTTGGRDG